MNKHRFEPYDPEEPDLLGQYLRQIGRTPLLTAEQEVELAKRIEAGVYARHLLDTNRSPGMTAGRAELEMLAVDGELAKEHMVRANLRLVVSVAKKVPPRGLPLIDLIQEGNLGLIHAVEMFDYAKGFKFSTYATWWIRQAIYRGIGNTARMVRLPVHVVDDLARLTRVARDLERAGADPTDEQLAEAAGLTVEKVASLRRTGRDTVSLDSVIGDDGENVLGDLIMDTAAPEISELLEFRALGQELRSLIARLPEREAMILTLRYGLDDGRPRTLQDIASRIGLTRERVRQLEREALDYLRRPDQREHLQAWVG